MLRTPPAEGWRVYVDDRGQRCLTTDNPEEDVAFNRWDREACEHEDGTLLHYWLGNIAGIGVIRAELSARPEAFPTLLSKVVYSGIHAGDYMTIPQIVELAGELQVLTHLHSRDLITEEWLRDFERKMSDLVRTALKVGKPIVF